MSTTAPRPRRCCPARHAVRSAVRPAGVAPRVGSGCPADIPQQAGSKRRRACRSEPGCRRSELRSPSMTARAQRRAIQSTLLQRLRSWAAARDASASRPSRTTQSMMLVDWAGASRPRSGQASASPIIRMRPVIALLTDFGTATTSRTMKACAEHLPRRRSSTSPTTRRADVLGGRSSSPRATVSLRPGSAVVDPGVGSARRGIAAEAGDYRFVAPDNGCLTAVFQRHAADSARRADRAPVLPADRQPHVRRPRSFAPAAAWLAARHRS